MRSKLPSGGMKEMVRSFSNRARRTHWWNLMSSSSTVCTQHAHSTRAARKAWRVRRRSERACPQPLSRRLPGRWRDSHAPAVGAASAARTANARTPGSQGASAARADLTRQGLTRHTGAPALPRRESRQPRRRPEDSAGGARPTPAKPIARARARRASGGGEGAARARRAPLAPLALLRYLQRV